MIDPLQLLPRELREQELYVLVAELLKQVQPDLEPIISYQDNPIIKQIFKITEDKEAARAYFNLYIKPIIGTRAALDSLFEILKYDVTVTEWFNSNLPIPAYKFIAEFNTLPYALNVDDFVETILCVKNERSWPAVIKTTQCSSMLYLDYSKLDRDFLSSFEGSRVNGVTVCLYNYLKPDVVFETAIEEVHQSETCIKYMFYNALHDRALDYFRLGDKVPEDGPRVRSSTASMVSVEKAIPDVIANSYRRKTFICQIVLSDYETLSNGKGFIGSRRLTESNYLLSDGLRLSEASFKDIILVCEWIKYPQEVDATPSIDALRTVFTMEAVLTSQPAADVFNFGSTEIVLNTRELKRPWLGPWYGAWDSPYVPGTVTMHESETI